MKPSNNHFKKFIARSLFTVGLVPLLPLTSYAQATHSSRDWAQITTGYKEDSLREFSIRLRSAREQANKDPQQKQPVTIKANVTAEGRTGIRHLRIRDFNFLSDGAINSGEYNLGPGSWPTLVGVLGSAVAQEFLLQASLKRIPLDNLEVVFTSTPGPAPSWTGHTIIYPRDLAYTAYIDSPATDAQLEELRQTVERESAVLNLVREKQEIPHAELIYTSTPKDRGAALAGLRDFLAGKRAAANASVQAEAETRPKDTNQTVGEGRSPQHGQKNAAVNAAVQVPKGATSTKPGGANETAPLRAVVKVEGSTGIRNIRTDDSNFQIIHDFPRYLGGHNLGPVAEEHILGVMTTCLTHIFEIQAANWGVDLDFLRLEVEGTLSSRPGTIGQSPRFSNIHYRVYIGSPASKEKVAELVEAVEAICPIYNLLRNSNEISGKVARGTYREPKRDADGVSTQI